MNWLCYTFGGNLVLRLDMKITEGCLNDDLAMKFLETFSDRCNISQYDDYSKTDL